MSRPDLDLLLALCGEAEKSDPESLKPVPADMAALDPETVRSLIQDAKIGRLAREVRSARVYAAAEQSRLFDDDSIQGAPYSWIKRMDEANRDVDALLAEVRRLRGQVEARDRALDDVSKFMEWRAARRAVETVSINSFVQPGGDL